MNNEDAMVQKENISSLTHLATKLLHSIEDTLLSPFINRIYQDYHIKIIRVNKENMSLQQYRIVYYLKACHVWLVAI